MSEYIQRGSEWRRWDLHVHTKGTMKNDQFESKDFNSFCITMFRKAIENNISAIGITDYFNIDNYKEVGEFVDNLSPSSDFNEEEVEKIRKIFILPNVELRMLPVTDKKNLINIHCLFNPEYTPNLENDFFARLTHCGTEGYLMNKQDITNLGRSENSNLDKESAYKEGVEKFVVSHQQLQKLLNTKRNFRANTIIVVSNSSNDGASGLQEHCKLVENESGNLNSVRESNI